MLNTEVKSSVLVDTGTMYPGETMQFRPTNWLNITDKLQVVSDFQELLGVGFMVTLLGDGSALHIVKISTQQSSQPS